jgi:hypothetical protein
MQASRASASSRTGQNVGSSKKPLFVCELTTKPFSFRVLIAHSISLAARLGEQDASFEWLERAFQERVNILIYLKIHFFFAALHGDPRYDALVKPIGIP